MAKATKKTTAETTAEKTPTDPATPAADPVAPEGSGPTVPESNEISSNTNPASREAGDTSGPDNASAKTADLNEDGQVSNEEAALAPVIQATGGTPSAELQARIDQTLANTGDGPKPTMVNGQYVGDKVYNAETDTWVKDPDAAGGEVRASTIFDRIGDAFMHERQRLVIEEIARFAGMTDDNTQSLPDGMPTHGKSTASLRTDATGYGGYAAGGPGPKPVEPGVDGQSQVGDNTVSE